MQVSPINNSQPNFNGTVHKSTIELIDYCVKGYADEIVQKANSEGKSMYFTDLEWLKKCRNRIIYNFQEYMAKLHKDTILRVIFPTSENTYKFSYFELQNPIGKGLRFLSQKSSSKQAPTNTITSDTVNISDPLKNKEFKYGNPNLHEIGMIENFLMHLQKIDPKLINQEFLNSAINQLRVQAENTSLLNRIKVALQMKKIDSYAKATNISDGKIETLAPEIEEIQKRSNATQSIVDNNNLILDIFKKSLKTM